MADTGIVSKVEKTEDEAGGPILRAIVDFYDGASRELTFETVWKKVPVRIVEAK